MICINRKEILSYMSPDMTDIEKRCRFLSLFETLLPKATDNISKTNEVIPAREDISFAIKQALSSSYCIEPIYLSENDTTQRETPQDEDAFLQAAEDFTDNYSISANCLGNDKALSMIINEDIVHNAAYTGEVFGRYNEETGRFHALFPNPSFDKTHPSFPHPSIGFIVPPETYWLIIDSNVTFEGYDWFGSYVEGNWLFNKTDKRRSTITVTEQFSFISKAYSRNTGLLETDIMQGKTVILVGLGSIGSYVAMQLVKAGVSNFILCDSDTLEIHNLSRHWLGLPYVGEFKVDAMAHQIRNVNPFANVKTFRGLIQNAPDALFSGTKPGEGIVIATGDNRMCAAQANNLAKKLNIPFVAIGCWVRASSGEVFTWHSASGLPTYTEAFEGLISDNRDIAHRSYFGEAEDATKVRFEPGIWEDITFVSEIGIKLALDMMNLKESRYTTRVYDHLTNYTLICNTNKVELGGERASLFPFPLFITNRSHGIWLREKGDAACLTISLMQKPN